MNHLVPCPGCARHVRQSETSCPFCSAALSLDHLPAPVLPRSRLSRAAMFAFGTGVAGAASLVGCGGDTDEGKKDGGGGSEMSTPVYGAPAAGQQNFGGSGPVYGSPPGGSGGVAGMNSGGGPVYGSPPAGMNAGGNAGEGGVGGEGGAGGDDGSGGTINIGPVYGTPPTPPQSE